MATCFSGGGSSSGGAAPQRASVQTHPLRTARNYVAPRPVQTRRLHTARTYVAPSQIPRQCPLMDPAKAQIDQATKQCVNALTRTAQLRSCSFEDDTDTAEDQRTGLSCSGHQAALARQCSKRCAGYASDRTHLACAGSYPKTLWHISFGDISGYADSARVDLCGPPLRASVVQR
jgi:hypothetical protein